jgi:hypothetical protein
MPARQGASIEPVTNLIDQSCDHREGTRLTGNRPSKYRSIDLVVTDRCVEAPGREQGLKEALRLGRESGYSLNNFNADILEELLNRAFAKFVREVAADAEIRGALR